MESKERTLAPRYVSLTTRKGSEVRRTLPHRDIFMIGAWCFIDHYGPTDSADLMSIGAHPHIGLQTVSWLFSGHLEHRDSLGSVQKIKPGELNVMTAGYGIAHSELSQIGSEPLRGVQLWIALPESVRGMAPQFHHHADLPQSEHDGFTFHTFIGRYRGDTSPAEVFTNLVGVEISTGESSTTELPVVSEYEYGILVDEGELTINGAQVRAGELHYLPAGSATISVTTTGASRFLLLGGEAFPEKIVMWWNFVASSHEEIATARADWQAQNLSRFAYFSDALQERIPAPEMPNLRLTARARQRNL